MSSRLSTVMRQLMRANTSRSISTSPRTLLAPAVAARKVAVPITAKSPSTPDEFDIDTFPEDAPSSPSKPASTPTRTSNTFQPTPSAPLTSFPNDSYKPLPTAGGIPGEQSATDWTTSFAGLSDKPFDKEVAEALLKPLKPEDVEIKPDGLLYLPEIKYRRTLNAAFGPGGWGLAPRGETHVTDRNVSREWGLICLGRLVSVARGEQDYFDPSGVATATEACKSNALMRCCKDLGIASELWDPSFIRDFKSKHCLEVFTEHATTKKKKKLWRKKDAPKFEYPWKEGR